MKTVKETQLHYQKGTSNKVYNVYLVEISTDAYLVNFEYGKTGGNLKQGTKTASPVELVKAQKLFDSLVNSKIKKEYKVKSGFNSSTGKEKKERDSLSSNEYKALLIKRLTQAGELEKNSLKKVDHHEVSRLIYRAGELKIKEAKALIVDLYNLNSNENNAFYYAVAWALGRYQEPSLRATIESLRKKLDPTSCYIVEEALFALNEPQERLHIEALTLPMPYSASLQPNSDENFINQVEMLQKMIAQTHQRYKEADDYWDDELKRATKKELMPLLKQADEIYLKLYMLAILDKDKHRAMIKIIPFLPLNEFNFSLFRRLYKMAEFREDHAVLAELITKIESQKMACYQSYDYNKNKYKPTLGCSRLYFKKRSLRYLNTLARYDEDGYLNFAKHTLLSMNHYKKLFEPFVTEWYDSNWNLKTKKYDAFSSHLTFMSILYGAGKRYMLLPSKKMWETANPTIKDEHRPEMHKEIWDKNPTVALEILSKSTLKEVQTFAFTIIEENPDVIANASLKQLLPMLNLHYDKAREFFFTLLKKRYAEKKEPEIIKSALFSLYPPVVDFALKTISKERVLLDDAILISEAIYKIKEESRFSAFVELLADNSGATATVEEIIKKIENSISTLYKNRTILILKQLISSVTIPQIDYLLTGEDVGARHYIALKLIRYERFLLELPLEIKEKIAQHSDPEMLATTIYLLGKLSDQELMNAHEMLVSFLYHEEVVVHKEANKIISKLGENQKNAEILLGGIVEKSFASASDGVAKNVEKTVKSLAIAYSSMNIDQLYRMLIAKSRLALALGTIILKKFHATDFSVVQWARLAKNPNKAIRLWAYDAYMNNIEMVQKAMPKSLMIFDTHWEDTRQFSFKYFESFTLSSDEIVVIADSNHQDVQLFAKRLIEQGDFEIETILAKLSQHPSLTIQRFVTDLMLGKMENKQLIKMERFFNTLLHTVNANRVAKTRVMKILNSRIENKEVAQMYARLASHHSATMVWADKEIFVEAMSHIQELYPDIVVPLVKKEIKTREVV